MAKLDIVLIQRRFSLTENGSVAYKIELSATHGADPALWTHNPPIDTQLLVLTLDTDAFARVATIADLDLVPSLRDQAVLESRTEYRSSTVTLSFEDLDTAIAAINVIRDRVDNVVIVWNKARTDFIIAEQAYNLPLAASVASVEGALEVSYTEARDARVEAETEQTTAQTAYDASQTTTTIKRASTDIHCDYKDRLLALNTKGSTVTQALTDAIAALNTAALLLNRSTRVDKSGTCEANGDTSRVLDTGKFAGVSAGDLVAVTYAIDHATVSLRGKTEVRTISVVTASNSVTTFSAFSAAPSDAGAGDQWETRLLTEFLPADDFGSAAANSVRVSKSKDSLSELTTSLGTEYNRSNEACGSAKSDLDAALSVEDTTLATLNDRKAAKDASQTLEDTATAALQDYCPEVDLTKL